MFSWGIGVVLCLFLLTGCGSSNRNLVKVAPAPPPEQVAASVDKDTDADEPLTEELSAKRLEELYAKSGIPGWDPGLEEELKKWDHQVKFDVPIHTNRQVRAYLVYFSTERKGTIRRYLSRSTRYLPMIKEVFREYGLPEDLAYLAMIESGFNPHAYSHAHACGMWQFIRGTGARYGLSMDSYVDERRDPGKSTRAAAQYLLDLYKQFGSWYLAAASYNCGEGRVQKELNKSNHKNFWELSDNMCLPNETKNYVPQMIAATIIAKNPEKFGFKKVPYLPPLNIERVQVKETISLKAAAMAINVPVEEVQHLNPELLRGITPPGVSAYSLNLPAHSKEAFAKNIMLASMEHPAVAKASRVAKKSGWSKYHRASRAKSGSSRHERSYAKPANHKQERAHAKSSKKSRATAKKSGKKGKIQVASTRKGKSSRNHRTKTGIRTASMIPTATASKSHSQKRGKVAAKTARTKVKGLARAKSHDKKSNIHLSKRTGKSSGSLKNTKKGKSSARSRYKGKSKKGKAVLVSKAR
ncbi:MAG: transglycosylase SLT domain-containing protein [Syntrophales bacterium]|nr:transglycosylase SLT domain-containing protein [Syntrophales bacterium]